LIHGEGIEKFGTVFSVSCLLAKEQQKKALPRSARLCVEDFTIP